MTGGTLGSGDSGQHIEGGYARIPTPVSGGCDQARVPWDRGGAVQRPQRYKALFEYRSAFQGDVTGGTVAGGCKCWGRGCIFIGNKDTDFGFQLKMK